MTRQGLNFVGLFLIGLIAFSATGATAQDEVVQNQGGEPKTLVEKANFIIGYSFFKNLKSQHVEIDIKSLIAGMQAAAEDKEIGIADEEIAAVMESFENRMRIRLEAKLKAEAEENLTAGEKFLETNRAVDGVTSLPSGVQYKVLRSPTGESPAASVRAEEHYTGKLIDGTVFDSSVERGPAVFAVGGVIKGFSEALQKMKVGEKWEVTIPAHLAYGVNAPPEIGPNQVLVFEIELIKLVK